MKIFPKKCFSKTFNSKRFFHLKTSSVIIPHPEKAQKGGEDALFISKCQRLMGVADGVGGWSLEGVDPSLYSKSLMEKTKIAFEEEKLEDLVNIIDFAHVKVKFHSKPTLFNSNFHKIKKTKDL